VETVGESVGVAILVVGVVVALVVVLLARREATAQRARAVADVDDARRRAAALLEAAKEERELAAADQRAREQRVEAGDARLAARAEQLDLQETGLGAQREDVRARAEALREAQHQLLLAQQQVRAAQDRIDDAGRDLGRRKAEAEAAGDAARKAAEEAREELEAAGHRARHAMQQELERIAGLTAEQANAALVNQLEEKARRQALVTVRTIEDDARREGEQVARRIVADAVQRVAADQTAESVVSVVPLPSDDMKGRIIGREGRNIRCFEAVTGVNLVIDDTPGAVLLSCFDPVRRERARVTLEQLLADGRIHPVRIEAAYGEATAEVERLTDRAGAEAVHEVGVHGLDAELVRIIGQLRYRTSYGQNVLGHMVETAHVAAVMAAEIGVDVALVKRCAFLHDIGKALTHEVEGTHAMIGADLARRHGEHEDVVHAIAAHHDEIAPQTVEAVLTQAADACSASRPGARREALETYVERLNRLEAIALAHTGVEKVFAMSAGRDVRVMVQPDLVDDAGTALMARDIAAQIADELTYPGQIKVTVVRESRASATAS